MLILWGHNMTKRRSKGEGTIYQRKDKRWVGMYTVDTLEGTKRRAVYGKTKKEIRTKLTEAISNRDKGLVFDAGNLSVAEYLDRWLQGIEDSIGERTWKRHESIVRLHLKPAIGSTKLAVLSPLQVQSLYRAKSRTHLAPGSVKRIHTTLHKALKQAVRWQMIPRNPCDSVDAPKGYRGEIKPFDKEQVRVLLNTARESQPRLYALYVLGVTAGLRQSELIGLQWGELDLSGGRLTVKRSVFKGKVSTPKTARGSRTVKLTGLAVDALIRTSTGIVTFGYSPRATVRRLIAPTSTNTIGVDCWKMRGFRVHRFTLALGTLALPCC